MVLWMMKQNNLLASPKITAINDRMSRVFVSVVMVSARTGMSVLVCNAWLTMQAVNEEMRQGSIASVRLTLGFENCRPNKVPAIGALKSAPNAAPAPLMSHIPSCLMFDSISLEENKKVSNRFK